MADIAAIGTMDSNPFAPGDIADDRIARNRTATTRKPDQTIVDPLDHNPMVVTRIRPRFDGSGHGQNSFLRRHVGNLRIVNHTPARPDLVTQLQSFLLGKASNMLIAQTRDDLAGGQASITDRRVHVFNRIECMPAQDRLQIFGFQ